MCTTKLTDDPLECWWCCVSCECVACVLCVQCMCARIHIKINTFILSHLPPSIHSSVPIPTQFSSPRGRAQRRLCWQFVVSPIIWTPCSYELHLGNSSLFFFYKSICTEKHICKNRTKKKSKSSDNECFTLIISKTQLLKKKKKLYCVPSFTSIN